MAYAFAHQEMDRRALEDAIEVIMGGTHPADQIHDKVVHAMYAIGLDISDRTPREVTVEDLQQSDFVLTMGCSADDVCPASWAGENRDWELDDPAGKSPTIVAEIRDEIQYRVSNLFDEVETDT